MKGRKGLDLSLGLLALLVLALVLAREPRSAAEIEGVWEGHQQGKEVRFTFRDDGTCRLEFRDPATGRAERLDGRFELELSKAPAALTFRQLPQLDHPLHTAIELVGRDAIRMASFATRWRLRPVAVDRNTALLLRRVADGARSGP